jgi:alkylhydroperoxidase/carboxymuconolactone decarboxylase family protein YurZ
MSDHYAQTMGGPPPQLERMAAMDPELFERYTAMRELFYSDREGGLDRGAKELLFILLNVVVGNPHGAMNHLEPARAAGVSGEQLRDGLTVALLIGGVACWGLVGAQVWEAWSAG